MQHSEPNQHAPENELYAAACDMTPTLGCLQVALLTVCEAVSELAAEVRATGGENVEAAATFGGLDYALIRAAHACGAARAVTGPTISAA